ncbi:MAG: cysteine desulfurase family protein [Planctomycetales bacterium]|jgi:cysteine desulfurase
MVKTPIYLDNHATTRCDPRVVDAMLPYFSESFGNASSTSHQFGWDAKDAVDRSREQVAALINADPRNVIFTSGATEASNLAIKGIVQPLLRSSNSKPPHIITNAAEHRATLDPIKRLQRIGADITVLPVDEYGQVDAEQVADALRGETSLVSIMLANNEIGTINPISEIAEVCRSRNVPLHCDAVQAVGRIPVDVEELKADLISISAHKLYGPKGVGALIVRRGNRRTRPEALIDGGGHENGLRSGTLPVPLIVGFGRACQLAGVAGLEEAARIENLRDSLWTEISSRLDGLHLNGHPTERLPGNLNVSFEGIDGDVLMNSLKKIAVSSGSACTSAERDPSHVLRAIGRSDQLTRASIRFGIGRFNTREEIDYAGNYVVETVTRLRNST